MKELTSGQLFCAGMMLLSVLLWLEIWLGLVIRRRYRRIRWLIYRWRLSRLARKEKK